MLLLSLFLFPLDGVSISLLFYVSFSSSFSLVLIALPTLSLPLSQPYSDKAAIEKERYERQKAAYVSLLHTLYLRTVSGMLKESYQILTRYFALSLFYWK